jgi:hypothetical protein
MEEEYREPMPMLDQFLHYRIYEDPEVFDKDNENFIFEGIIYKMNQYYLYLILYMGEEVNSYAQLMAVKKFLSMNLFTLINLQHKYMKRLTCDDPNNPDQKLLKKWNKMVINIEIMTENLKLYDSIYPPPIQPQRNSIPRFH